MKTQEPYEINLLTHKCTRKSRKNNTKTDQQQMAEATCVHTKLKTYIKIDIHEFLGQSVTFCFSHSLYVHPTYLYEMHSEWLLVFAQFPHLHCWNVVMSHMLYNYIHYLITLLYLALSFDFIPLVLKHHFWLPFACLMSLYKYCFILLTIWSQNGKEPQPNS